MQSPPTGRTPTGAPATNHFQVAKSKSVNEAVITIAASVACGIMAIRSDPKNMITTNAGGGD